MRMKLTAALTACLCLLPLVASSAAQTVAPRPGDIIIGVNGKRIDTFATFVAELDRVGIGNVAEIRVNRDGAERTVKVKVVDVLR